MAPTHTSLLLLLLSMFLLASAALAVSDQDDPELKYCIQQCRQEGRFSTERELRECESRCEKSAKEKEERRREAGEDAVVVLSREDSSPEERLQQCQQWCETQHRHDEKQRGECELQCQEKYEKEQKERGGGEENPAGRKEEAEEEEEEEEKKEEEEEEGRSPYFFDRRSFRQRVRTEHGSVRVLERFTKRSSELLRAIEDYRLAFLEANPNAFVLPHHIDADTIYYVANGRGTIKMLRGENWRESHNIRCGDIVTAYAGTVVYMVNTDSNEKLQIVMLLRSVSTPGEVREFFGVGGEDPESYLRSFSDELLQAAFNARKEAVDRMFGRLKKGAIVGASQEQVRSMSRAGGSSESEGGRRPAGESTGPFNLLSKRPSHSSRHGQIHEATADDCRELRDLDVQVSFANITGGSMTAPFYLTRSTKMIVVEKGDGYSEMACPHMGAGERQGKTEKEEGKRGSGQERRAHYQKVRSRLSRGTVIVVPAGHPVAIVASRGQNLQVLCFEINAKNNQRIFLAGKNNILKQLESEAKELSFDNPAKEVDEFLNRRKESELMPGPEQQEKQQSSSSSSLKWGSILDFAGF